MEAKNTILIVDDTPTGRQTLEILLLPLNQNLVFAENGTEAIQKAVEIVPDLILLDIMMPEIDGFEVCRRLRADKKLSDVPIVMVTALDNKEAKIEGINAGADDFITKPFDKEELRARVNTVLRLNRYRKMIAERTKFEWAVEKSEDGYIIINTSDEIVYINEFSKKLFELSDFTTYANKVFFSKLAEENFLLEPESSWKPWPPEKVTEKDNRRYLVKKETNNSTARWIDVDILNIPSLSDEQKLLRLKDVTGEITNQRNIHTFQSMVTHKMITPLTSMLYSFDFIQKELSNLGDIRDKSKDSLLKLFESAKSDLERLQKEINVIVRYVNSSHISGSGKGITVKQIKRITDELKIEQNLLSLEFITSMSINNLTLSISENSMRWILTELFENSIKFHPFNNPDIKITIDEKNDEMLKLCFEDNGVSIASDKLEKVWQPYYQIEKHFTGEVPGMGLGLSVIESLIWEIGGKCRLMNKKSSEGVVVELVIPFQKTKEITETE